MRYMVLSALLLAGCSTLGPSISESGAAISAYEGGPVSAVIDRIGYPDREEKIAGKTVYFWGQDMETGPSCVWKVVTEDDGTVIDGSVYGNIYGCEARTRRLQGR